MSDVESIGAELPPAPVFADSFFPANYVGSKCVIMCRGPRIVYGWKGPKCPHCGGKTALYGEKRPLEDRAHDAGERFAAAIWHALTFPFRRPAEADELEYCGRCTDAIGPVCEAKGCLWDILTEAREATEEAREGA
jgi:hypothetical protein